MVGFWDALDYVGVDFYAPVSGRNDAGRVEILKGWQPWLYRLEILHGLAGRPIVLTEIGYRSVDGAGQAPYSYAGAPPIDLGEQADLYWAAMEAVSGKSWIEGMYWWNWLAGGEGGPQNRDYTPFGKPAQEELTGAWTQ
jgi:hypothetical protein